MKACIVSIGNELLNGQTTDTNMSWLSGRLLELGIATVGGWTVPDEIPPIVKALEAAADRAELVLVTGGLGPTDDDLTRQAMAAYLGVELQFRPDVLDEIASFFSKRGMTMAEKNRSQAYIPAGCDMLVNGCGTAPGFGCQKDGRFFAVLPGVPTEMVRMFDEQVLPRIRRMHTDCVVVAGKVRCFGSGESTIAQRLGDLMDRRRNPLINCTCGSGEIVLHIIAEARDRAVAEKLVSEDKTLLNDILGEWIYGYDADTLPAIVGKLLMERGCTIAVAESCTGGLISKLLTDIPGSSQYVKAGWVTYSNEVKIHQLGVPRQLIEDCGAVSEPVARAMALGAAEKAGADVAVGITGIAGPGGGTDEKPVGLVYIAMAIGGVCKTEECRFPPSNREFIRQRAALTALNLLRMQLQI